LEGSKKNWWGENRRIELTVLDEDNNPWFALGRETEEKNYFVLHLSEESKQEDFLPQERLSNRNPGQALGNLAQQYAFVKSLRTLLQDDYQIVDEAQRADQSRVVTLQKQDSLSGEQLQVRMIFQPSGNASILTDARRPGGEHGTCPDMTSLLDSMDITEYEKWLSPDSQRVPGQPKRGQPVSEKQAQRVYRQDIERYEEL
jgi:hypothetical protein